MGYLMLSRHGQVEGLQTEALRFFSCPEMPQTLGRTSLISKRWHTATISGMDDTSCRKSLFGIAGYHSERKDACIGNCSSHDSISEYKHITRERWESSPSRKLMATITHHC